LRVGRAVPVVEGALVRVRPHLDVHILAEKVQARHMCTVRHLGRDAVVADVEEAVVRGRIVDLARHTLAVGERVTKHGRDVDKWDLGWRCVPERRAADGPGDGAVAGRQAELHRLRFWGRDVGSCGSTGHGFLFFLF